MRILKGFAILLSSVLITNAFAEYYLDYPEPDLNNMVDLSYPKHQSYRHSKSYKPINSVQYQKRKSSYHISIYYIYPCPAYPCKEGWDSEYCYDRMLEYTNANHRFNRGYVTFDNRPASNYRVYEPYDKRGSDDLRTEDDDVMHYPDMNNQY